MVLSISNLVSDERLGVTIAVLVELRHASYAAIGRHCQTVLAQFLTSGVAGSKSSWQDHNDMNRPHKRLVPRCIWPNIYF